MKTKDKNQTIMEKSLENFEFCAKIKTEVKVPKEFKNKLRKFLEAKDVKGGVRVIVTSQLRFEPEVQFDCELEHLDGTKRFKKVSFGYEKNERLDDYRNVLLVSIVDSPRNKLVRYCQQRDIPYAREVAAEVDLSKTLHIMLFGNASTFEKFLPENNNGQILGLKEGPAAFFDREAHRLVALNPNTDAFAVYEYTV